jgi:hypothetical protein
MLENMVVMDEAEIRRAGFLTAEHAEVYAVSAENN